MIRLGLRIAAVVIILDQITKRLVLAYFAHHPEKSFEPVTPFFNLVLTHNHGMSFGLFNSNGSLNALIFTVLAAVIVSALIVWLRQVETPRLALAIGLVIGGAIGNVIDRLLWRGVIDFLDFYVTGCTRVPFAAVILPDCHWYAFNLADSAICLGVGLMIIDSLLGGRRTAHN
jgi:signal peptidase II